MNMNPDSEPLDLSYLSEMVGEHTESMIEVIDSFLVQTPIYWADIKKAFYDENFLEVAKGLHKIKPTFSYMGRDDLKERIAVLELSFKEPCKQKFEELNEKLAVLEQDLKQVYFQLNEAKARLSKPIK